ncbi:VWA domain-containing protein [Piscinibacter sp.]|uniref:VWA domain-containing protein n=1 Tax=Piscinibacter sp. TaxID=1903157 RepID=UPI002CDE10BE|nr:VWA domain-containing protein [Albitalea sp.]HUG21918.1 VWA domain-containing protein [Albitalea sp.]
MAEAEDVIVDAARHATSYAQDLLRRRRVPDAAPALTLLDAAPRLDLLLTAMHGRAWPLRVAQAPAPVTTLTRLFRRASRPWRRCAVPSTDGVAIWLPRELPGVAPPRALLLYRAMAVQQAQRGACRDVHVLDRLTTALQRDVYLALEADAACVTLGLALPGLQPALRQLRDEAFRQRPGIDSFAGERRALETWLRTQRADAPATQAGLTTEALVERALALTERWAAPPGPEPLFKDWWTGDWAPREASGDALADAGSAPEGEQPVRSARLARRPTVRESAADEDDAQPGAWMIQTAQPHEHAEDPMGQQRPTDRDAQQAAEAHAESVSELAQARLVRSSQPAHEVLLSEDLPPSAPKTLATATAAEHGLRYPEWNWRTQAYLDPGTTVWESVAQAGPAEWVERTLQAQRCLLHAIQRRFELLRAQREVLRRQEDGDEIDIEAVIEARADLRAGASLSQRLYRSTRLARRDAAVLVLVDISGSTDAWIAGRRRIIDVEREALLPLSVALDGTGDPHAILAFSGEGPHGVVVRTVKRFDERHGDEVARRIAGLEPERYTRAGAALRHANRLLAAQPARHRLLLLLSDGKPNDCDDYDGRYGVEDMRQAVLEARQAGLSLFCLTVDRQAASYLPRVFGPHHYALLQQPERLPVVLLDWMKRLLSN